MKNLEIYQNIIFIFIVFLRINCTTKDPNEYCLSLNYYDESGYHHTGISVNVNGCGSNYKYIIGCQCRKNCYEYYKRNKDNYIICYSSLNEVLNDNQVKFFDTYQKKCWQNFPSDEPYYIKTKYDSNKLEVVQWCPNYYSKGTNGYPSEYENYNWCVDNCQTEEEIKHVLAHVQKFINIILIQRIMNVLILVNL